MKNIITLFLLITCSLHFAIPQQMGLRNYGLSIGILPTGPENSITDVSGVLVGHFTIKR